MRDLRLGAGYCPAAHLSGWPAATSKTPGANKMKTRHLFLLVSLFIGCSQPTPRNLRELVQQGDAFLSRETMSPYSGPVFEFFPDDTTRIQRTGTLKEGRFHGPYESYADGQVTKGVFADGKLDGPQETHRANGVLATRMSYVRGVLASEETFGDNGKLVTMFSYADGVLSGPFESHLPLYDDWPGSYEKGSYKDGKKEGAFEDFYASGALRARGTYMGGELEGAVETYEEDGQLDLRGSFHKDARCGEWHQLKGQDTVRSTYPPCP